MNIFNKKRLNILIFVLFCVIAWNFSGIVSAKISNVASKLQITGTTGNIAEVNSDNQLHVVLMGATDTGNSTTTPLLADAVFTGTAINTLDYGFIFVTIFADQDSATDGLSFQQSSDGTNWDNTDNYNYLTNSGKTYSIQPAGKWFRVVYTNGSTNQGVFRLSTVFKKTSSLSSSHRISENLSPEDDGTLGISIIKGQNPSGNYVDFSATAGGNFKISLEEYDTAFTSDPLPVRDPMLSMARGLLTGITHVNKYGRATDGVQLTATDIWDRADASVTQQIWVAPTQARVHNITSSSTADDGTPEGAGAGAQAIRVWGLTSWSTDEVTEDVILNGTANVATSNSYVIIHRMKIIEVGSTYNINTGNITATAVTDGTITAQISAGEGQTLMAIYGVPSTKTVYVDKYKVNSHNTGNPSTVVETDFTLLVNERPDLNLLTFLNKGNIGLIASGSSDSEREFRPYAKIVGPAILKIQAISTLADTEGVAEFDLILVDN